MTELEPSWSDTALPGLQVRRFAERVVGIRLLGWEALLPLSVVEDAIDQEGPALRPPSGALPQAGVRSGG